MKLQPRDKRALLILGAAVPAMLLLRLALGTGGSRAVVGAPDSVPLAEKRLERVRRLAASVPGKQEVLKRAAAELAEREKTIIQAETAAQAQAQLLEILRRIGKSMTPPIEFGTVEVSGQIAQFGDEYGEVRIAVPFTCRIEDLVNFLAELTRQPEMLATTDLRVAAGDARQKTINVRLTASAVVPRRLVPQRRNQF